MLETLGHYRILELVGSTPLGEVCRARDTQVGRTVTITVVGDKILSDPSKRERFLRDARAAVALSHPNIVTLYAVGEEDGYLYVVHEFTQGQTLNTVIAGQPLNVRRAVDIASQVAEGLADGHAAEIVHGAITGDTIVVTPKGTAKVGDFGTGRWMAGRPDDQCDARTDIAAVGTLLFQMLTGRAPAPGAAVPSAANRSLPREIDPIVAKALGRSGGYESAATLAAELRAVAATLDRRMDEVAISTAAARRPNRASAPWIAAALAIAGIAAALWWYLRSF
jgi:eukaryotic-like serine/threonine-protein kinase